jgi:hypothetical protein
VTAKVLARTVQQLMMMMMMVMVVLVVDYFKYY